MERRSIQRFLTVSLLLGSMLASGCGRINSGTTPELLEVAPVVSATDEQPLDDLTAPLNPAPATSVQPIGDTSCEATGLCPSPLAVQNLNKKKRGFLWRKLLITGQVLNAGAGPAKGELQIRFLKKGAVVQTEFKKIIGLAPGQTFLFSVESNQAADDVAVTVSGPPADLTATTPLPTR